MAEGVSIAIDPHVHSEQSYDGREPVELILAHASAIGLDGVVITDHDEIAASRRAAELAEEFGLVGIPGVEVSTAEGHLLAIGVDQRPVKGMSLEKTIEIVREDGGAAIVPHPFQRSRHGVRKRNLTDCDAIEVFNSMVFTGYRNRRARAFASRNDYPAVGASDAHYLPFVGRAYTEITLGDTELARPDVDGEVVVDAIRSGATRIQGKRTPITRSIRQYANGATKKALYGVAARVPGISVSPYSSG
ncbi:Predicted metal-dependent phosphoesterase TrpH, contains PHP domain [Natronoarchaeum philippinense]|uniref:Predicted metal-dependent phosphoesterase TrpH, contains PHP domain n=1 Tax=Natronoarchaeum philippinense TaxID=558529 RepID=A0A285N9P5_NATPI|nr:PHP domain-containing protein [Natronoarchaeum philippinense]SNZ06224.1 Predicted metal-dependent phosphoesterase TrpH, contains PHP domain [Natronoarchaeum philippinense]